MLFTPRNFYPGQVFFGQADTNFKNYIETQNQNMKVINQSHFNSFQNYQMSLSLKILAFFDEIRKMSQKNHLINKRLNVLQKNLLSMEEDLNVIDFDIRKAETNQSVQTTPFQKGIKANSVIYRASGNRTHPKIKFMQRVFGKKQYAFKLSYDGKFPKTLYKNRNISMKIVLRNKLGQPVKNGKYNDKEGNQISLNLKVFESNGKQIFQDKENSNFMNGACQTLMVCGVGNFNKIHPRQVSRNYHGKGVCIIVYANSQENPTGKGGLNVDASEIQPVIFYNVKVVVKQQKFTSRPK